MASWRVIAGQFILELRIMNRELKAIRELLAEELPDLVTAVKNIELDYDGGEPDSGVAEEIRRLRYDIPPGARYK
jgi:hypothetical protein